jgi:hypothetical protein
MATSTQEWIDELKSISVLELSERIKALEEAFGVSATAVAPVAAAGAAPADGGRRQEDPGDQGRPRRDRPGPEGGQGTRRRGPEACQGGHRQGRGRQAQGRPRRGRRLRRAQVADPVVASHPRRPTAGVQRINRPSSVVNRRDLLTGPVRDQVQALRMAEALDRLVGQQPPVRSLTVEQPGPHQPL